MMYYFNIDNKDAILEDGHDVPSRGGLRATGWDLWAEMMRYPDRFEPEYFKYYSCVATIDCETLNEAFHLTNSEEDFANSYYGKVTPLTGNGSFPSMSVGDIVLIGSIYPGTNALYDGKFFMCAMVGWTELKELNESRAESMAKTEALRAEILADCEYESNLNIGERNGQR